MQPVTITPTTTGRFLTTNWEFVFFSSEHDFGGIIFAAECKLLNELLHLLLSRKYQKSQQTLTVLDAQTLIDHMGIDGIDSIQKSIVWAYKWLDENKD